jgi:hypothetical protein
LVREEKRVEKGGREERRKEEEKRGWRERGGVCKSPQLSARASKLISRVRECPQGPEKGDGSRDEKERKGKGETKVEDKRRSFLLMFDIIRYAYLVAINDWPRLWQTSTLFRIKY